MVQYNNFTVLFARSFYAKCEQGFYYCAKKIFTFVDPGESDVEGP